VVFNFKLGETSSVPFERAKGLQRAKRGTLASIYPYSGTKRRAVGIVKKNEGKRPSRMPIPGHLRGGLCRISFVNRQKVKKPSGFTRKRGKEETKSSWKLYQRIKRNGGKNRGEGERNFGSRGN